MNQVLDYLTQRSHMDNWQVWVNCILYATVAAYAGARRRRR